MRRLLIILATIASVVITPVLAAKPLKDDQSPALKRCVQVCMQEKDATARESCEHQCVLTDAAQQQQDNAKSARPMQK
jgi:hypothetical protein